MLDKLKNWSKKNKPLAIGIGGLILFLLWFMLSRIFKPAPRAAEPPIPRMIPAPGVTPLPPQRDERMPGEEPGWQDALMRSQALMMQHLQKLEGQMQGAGRHVGGVTHVIERAEERMPEQVAAPTPIFEQVPLDIRERLGALSREAERVFRIQAELAARPTAERRAEIERTFAQFGGLTAYHTDIQRRLAKKMRVYEQHLRN